MLTLLAGILALAEGLDATPSRTASQLAAVAAGAFVVATLLALLVSWPWTVVCRLDDDGLVTLGRELEVPEQDAWKLLAPQRVRYAVSLRKSVRKQASMVRAASVVQFIGLALVFAGVVATAQSL